MQGFEFGVKVEEFRVQGFEGQREMRRGRRRTGLRKGFRVLGFGIQRMVQWGWGRGFAVEGVEVWGVYFGV